MKDKGNLFILSGPGGVGKNTLAQEILTRRDNLWKSISATTRKPRIGETPGQDYYFISKTDFDTKIRNGEFLEYAQVHGDWYGTLHGPTEEKIQSGIDILLVIDVHGGLSVRNNYQESVLIFLSPPSKQELEHRLQKRGLDDEQGIKARLQIADEEIRIGTEYYDYVIINDDLETAVSAVDEIISKQ